MSLLKQRAVIIEDEPHARARLLKLLECNDHIDVIGQAGNGEEGIKIIHELRPDIIFLDVQMPVLNGFDMLKLLDYEPKIIFTTAFEEFAIHAFEHNSIDYLLKPFSEERLGKAIDKLKMWQGMDMQRIQKIMQDISDEKRSGSISLSTGGKVIIVPYSDIVYLKADQKCIEIHDTRNRNHLIYTSLQKLAEKLPDYFLHVHRAYIINRNYVHSIRKGFRGQLIFEMADSEQTLIQTGKTYIKLVKEAIGMEA